MGTHTKLEEIPILDYAEEIITKNQNRIKYDIDKDTCLRNIKFSPLKETAEKILSYKESLLNLESKEEKYKFLKEKFKDNIQDFLAFFFCKDSIYGRNDDIYAELNFKHKSNNLIDVSVKTWIGHYSLLDLYAAEQENSPLKRPSKETPIFYSQDFKNESLFNDLEFKGFNLIKYN